MFHLSPSGRWSRRLALTILAAVVGIGACRRADETPTADDVRVRLEPGRPVAGRLVNETPAQLLVHAVTGDFLHLRVSQDHLDLSLRLFDPGGGLVQEVDGPEAWEDPEEVMTVVTATGEYRLEISLLEREADAASFRAELLERRPATPSDHRLVRATVATLRAEELRRSAEPAVLAEAEDAYLHALDLWREIGDRHQMGHILRRLGRLYHEYLHQPAAAIAAFRDAVAHFRAVGHRIHEASTWLALGRAQAALGDHDGAVASFRTALPDLLRLRDQAFVLNELGLIYDEWGEVYEARKVFDRGLELWRAAGDVAGEAATLHNRGRLLLGLGKIEDARDDLDAALRRFRAAGNRAEEAKALIGLGDAALGSGQYQQAIELYEQDRTIQRRDGNRREEAVTLNNLGLTRRRRGELGASEAAYQSAVQIFAEIGDCREEARTLHNLAILRLSRGHAEEAGELLDQAQSRIRRCGDAELEASVLLSRAETDRFLGRIEAAERNAGEAVARIESLREGPLSHDLRASFFARKQRYYDFYVDLLMDLHLRDGDPAYAIRAFEVSERARSRSFLDLLHESHTREPAPAEMVRDERQLARVLEQRAATHLDRSRTEPRTEEEERQLRSVLRRYDLVRTELQTARRSAPRGIETLTVAEIRTRLLDPDSLLLHYDLGPRRSFLWAVTASSIEVFELPPRAEVERLARKAHAVLAHGSQLFERSAKRLLRQLSTQLLAPVGQLSEGRRLLISADGALRYLPFGALPRPDGDEPLLVRHVVISIPSASVVAFLAERPRRRQRDSVAIVADGVFDSRDQRVPARAGERNEEPGVYDRLGYSGREAEAISELVPEDRRLLALGFDARRDLFFDGRLGDYAILHLATHGEHHVAQTLMRLGVLEWVHDPENQPGFWGGMGELNPAFSKHLSTLEYAEPVEPHRPTEERHNCFGFRLLRSP